MFSPGYSRVRTKDGRKLYGPNITSFGETRHLKKAQSTATDALEYSKKFIKTWERLHAKA